MPIFCWKEEQEYRYEELLQHATGAGNGSSNRSAKRKAKHLALVKFLETELATEVEPQPQDISKPSTTYTSKKNELYYWPWTGIIVNILNEPNSRKDIHDGGYWLKKLNKYNPLEVEMFKDKQGQTARAIVRFENNWTGFEGAIEFKKSFEANKHGKKKWSARKA